METTVYVDILLVLNYIISLLLILCTAKIAGILPKRRKIVAAALVGSLCSLTIFLPFMGFFYNLASRILFSALMVRVALPWLGLRPFLRHWFLFFAVNFFFAGVMLALWMTLSPRGMVYYNGVVYFHISAPALIAATVAAWLLLGLWNKIAKSGRLSQRLCRVEIYMGSQMQGITGLVDSGNSLTEPFSGAPVLVCWLEDVAKLLPQSAVEALRQGELGDLGQTAAGLSLRLIPYNGVEGGGVLPAFLPDRLVIHAGEHRREVPGAYVGLSRTKIGDGQYGAILHPEIIGVAAK